MATLYPRNLEILLQLAVVGFVDAFGHLPGHDDPHDERWKNCLSDVCDRRACSVCDQTLNGRFGSAFRTIVSMRRARRAQRRRAEMCCTLADATQITAVTAVIERLHAAVAARPGVVIQKEQVRYPVTGGLARVSNIP